MANINQITLIDTNKPDKVKEKLNELIQEVSGMELVVPTKEQIGLGDVDNTSDENKPVSNPQKNYIDNLDATNIKKDSDVAIGKNKKLSGIRTNDQLENLISLDNSTGSEVVLVGTKELPAIIHHNTRNSVGNNTGRNPKVLVKEADSDETIEELAFKSEVQNIEDVVNETVNVLVAEVNKLDDKLNSLNQLNRFLSTWNCVTGLPVTNPANMPFLYQNGDYYIIGTVSEEVNYKPNGTEYNGVASNQIESNTPKVNDIFVYDGLTWSLMDRNSVILSDINKANKVEGATAGNLASLNYEGDLEDSGASTQDLINAVEHIEETGNPHGTAFNELNGIPNTLEGYGLDSVVFSKDEVETLVENELQEVLDTKVDKVVGKELSENDYTNSDKQKVDIIDIDGDGDKYLSDDGSYKEISISTKLDKIVTGLDAGVVNRSAVYAVEYNDTEYTQTNYKVSDDAYGQTIMRRDANGKASISAPTTDLNITNKKYVDDIVKGKSVKDYEILTTDWVADSTYSTLGFNYKATIIISGVISTYEPTVIYSPADSVSDNFSNFSNSVTNGIEIWVKVVPSGTITIPFAKGVIS